MKIKNWERDIVNELLETGYVLNRWLSDDGVQLDVLSIKEIGQTHADVYINENHIKSFSTKSDAMKFAIEYMKKHPIMDKKYRDFVYTRGRTL